jgi:hypothetical protein
VHRTTRLVSGLASAALVAGGTLAAAPASDAASSKVTAPVDCPKAFPTSKAVRGVTGTGFTVETGTTPAPFTAKVLGRITDGIEPGTDLIMAKVSSPALSRAKGVWAGMSGSPVYAADGRLIGSVSYTLGRNTDIAGITPASALLPVLGGVPHAGGAGVRHVAVSGDQVRALVDAGVPAATAGGGFNRIALPLAVSGKATKQLLDALKAMPDLQLVQGAARAGTTPAPATAIHAGGNFVAALAYGTATLAATGTTTVVCKGKAVAFGHPFFSDGATQMTMHGGSAVYVQPDLLGAFKVVNPTGPVGVVDTDRTTGIRGVVGAKATRTLAVTSALRLGNHPASKGSTVVAYQPFAGQAAGSHLFSEAVRVLGYEGRGSASLTFVLKGVRANGKAFSLTRKDVYSDSYDLPGNLANSLFRYVDPLATQEFEDIRLTSLTITGTLSTSVRQFSVSKVEAHEGTRWVDVTSASTVPATPGKPLQLRVTATPYKGIGATKLVTLSVPVPAKAPEALGLELHAGPGDVDAYGASSVTELLSRLAHAPANDAVTVRLVDRESDDVVSSTTQRIGAAFGSYGNNWSVQLP